MWLASISTERSVSSGVPRAAAGATIPSRRDQIASVGTGGLSVILGNGGSSTLCPATHSYSPRTLVLVLTSPEKGEPSVTTARTLSGCVRASSRANSPPRLHPTSSTLRWSCTASSRRPSCSSVSARAPLLVPNSHG